MSARDDYPILAAQVVHSIPFAAPETLNIGELECFTALHEIDKLRADVEHLEAEIEGHRDNYTCRANRREP